MVFKNVLSKIDGNLTDCIKLQFDTGEFITCRASGVKLVQKYLNPKTKDYVYHTLIERDNFVDSSLSWFVHNPYWKTLSLFFFKDGLRLGYTLNPRIARNQKRHMMSYYFDRNIQAEHNFSFYKEPLVLN